MVGAERLIDKKSSFRNNVLKFLKSQIIVEALNEVIVEAKIGVELFLYNLNKIHRKVGWFSMEKKIVLQMPAIPQSSVISIRIIYVFSCPAPPPMFRLALTMNAI